MSKPHLFGFITCVSLVVPSVVHSAEFTDLADAADDMDDLVEETYDGFDFHFEPTFVAEFGSGQITREGVCVPDESDLVGEAAQNFRNSPRLQVDSERCSEPSLINNREIEYDYTQYTMNFALRAGLYKDLELRINIPYVLSQKHGYRYADGVNGQNSSVNPTDERISTDAESSFSGSNALAQLEAFSTYRFFNLTNNKQTFTRSGFGDPKVGLHWAPFNDRRDDTKATLLIGMDYVMPIAPIKRVDNDDVGRGVHELQWKVAASKQFDWIDPYFGLQYYLPLAASDSPLGRVDDGNNGQVFTNPPQRGEITIGTEFIPYEDVDRGVRYSIDLRFKFGYTSQGRDYNPLFDLFGNSECNGKQLGDLVPERNGDVLNPKDVQCAWIAQRPSNAPFSGGQADPIYDLSAASDDTVFRTDGIFTTEGYGTFAGKVGFNIQPSRYFQVRGGVSLTHHQSHFLTNARTGRDGPDSEEETPDQTVDLSGPDAEREKNPVFNPTYDGNGNRFRIRGFNIWTAELTAAFKF